jgi:hypothetical protein
MKPLLPAMTPYLDEIGALGAHCLARAEYPADLVPVRDRSIAGGSLFLYKSTASTGEVEATSEHRGFNRTHRVVAFGEIAAVEMLVMPAAKLNYPSHAIRRNIRLALCSRSNAPRTLPAPRSICIWTSLCFCAM